MPFWLISMENKSINIKQLVDKVRRHPLLADLSMEFIVEYTVDFLQIIGMPNAYLEEVDIIKIETYRGKLPDNFMEMVQVRTTTEPIVYYRYATDTFHKSTYNRVHSAPYTYKIQGGYIYTSEKETTVEISYLAIETDDCGLPLLPDNAKFIRALEAYIKYKHFTVLFDCGKITGHILEKADQEYCWAVGACQSDFNRLSIDKAETVLNLINNIFSPTSLHHTGYANVGDKVIVRR
jgi:hypothetical protein